MNTKRRSNLALDASWRDQVRQGLLTWFGQHARDLPWRASRDPYRIWVSEIMLQQTQVETVRPYFARFLEAFPNVHALAAASEEEVLRKWEGLGYYRRARQMHRAAQVIVEQHGGKFPQARDEVLALPGIGRYTAGAVLSIAFDAREPILEANSIRVLSRLIALDEVPTTASAQRTLWSLAEDLLPQENIGAFNQALMELGSKVCRPKSPVCEQCPAVACCRAQQQGQPEEYPRAGKRTAYEDRLEVAVVIRRHGRVLLRRCAEGERWAGLWDFPRFAAQDSSDKEFDPAQHIPAEVQRLTGCRVTAGEQIAKLKHGVTRYRITLLCHWATCEENSKHRGSDVKWHYVSRLNDLPLSVTGRKIAGLIG